MNNDAKKRLAWNEGKVQQLTERLYKLKNSLNSSDNVKWPILLEQLADLTAFACVELEAQSVVIREEIVRRNKEDITAMENGKHEDKG